MSFEIRNLSALPLRNVLIIDDEPAVHEMYNNVLRPMDGAEPTLDEDGDPVIDERVKHFNFATRSALNGQEGLAIVKEQAAKRRPIQMAFVDMRMPVWDGITTIGEIYDYDPRISFVIVTGFPEATQTEVADRLGAMPIRVIGKPAKLSDIYDSAYNLVARWQRIHGDD